MSVSHTELARIGQRYLFSALPCLIFALVYERFSHGIFSAYMGFAFLIPLLGGALPACALARSRRIRLPRRAETWLYAAGLAALTVGSLFQGALDIYGTTSRLVRGYWLAGAVLLFAALVSYARRLRDI